MQVIKINRSASADILKAISIFGVVYIHSIFSVPFSDISLNWISPIFRFCVPIFIMLWAFFAEKSISKHNGEKGYLAIRFYNLLVPFIFWSTIYFFLKVEWKSLTFTQIFTKHWSGYGWSGQYYFLLLFQFIAIFSLLRRLALYLTKHIILLTISSVLFYFVVTYSPIFLINSVAKIGDRLFIYWIPYVLFGIIWARTGYNKIVKLPIILGMTLPVIIPLEIYIFHPAVIKFSPYVIPSVFISSIALLLAFMSNDLKMHGRYTIFTRAVSLLAKNTLGIFCINPLIIKLFRPLFLSASINLNFFGYSLLLPIAFTIITIVLCIFLIFILKKLKLGMLVLS